MWAKRLKDVSREKVSFDLVNEPSMREDMHDQFGSRDTVPGAIYRKVAKETADAIRKYNPSRIVVADGNDVGSSVIPEIADLDIAQSCRGYFPHYISHYRAPWVFKNPDTAPMPVWPGTIENKHFGRESLEEFYKPWIELVKKVLEFIAASVAVGAKIRMKYFLPGSVMCSTSSRKTESDMLCGTSGAILVFSIRDEKT